MWSHRDPSLRKSGAGNIFVKNLDKSIDNKALFDTFSMFGNILSCKVATDEYGKSKSYGFIHYEDEESAKEAIEKVNGILLGTKNVYVGPFIKKSERAPTDTKFTNLYVKNFPDSVTESQLKMLFSPYGEITSMIIKSDNKNRRFCFINYAEADHAKNAMNNLNGKKITDDGQIDNTYDSTKEEADKGTVAASSNTTTTTTINNNSGSTTASSSSNANVDGSSNNEKSADSSNDKTSTIDNDVGSNVKENGDVTKSDDSKATATTTTNNNNNNAVDDTTENDATTSKTKNNNNSSSSNNLANTNEVNNILYVGPHQSRAKRHALLKAKFDNLNNENKNKHVGVNLYLKNLDDEIDDQQLKKLFEEYGTITSAKVMRDEKDHSKGFGFVCF
uniref:RRM domain-containing protein n=1 Tax=Piliocolobus tephrosceles TaxID=591936 RepID=A0A8C9LLB2_9PRIM